MIQTRKRAGPQPERQSRRRRPGGRISLPNVVTSLISLAAGISVTYLAGALPSGDTLADPLIVGLACLVLLAIGAVLYAERRTLISLPVLVGVSFLGYPLGALSYVLGWSEPANALIPVFSAHVQNRIYLVYALLLVLGGLMAWLTGYRLGLSRAPATTPHAGPPLEVNRSRLQCIVRVYALLGTAGTILYYQGQGGLRHFIEHVAYLRVVPVGTHYLSWVALLLPISALFWLGMDYQAARRNLWFWGLFALGFISLLSYANRWAPGGYLLIAGLIVLQRQAVSPRAILLLFVLAGAIVLLSLGIGAWRDLSLQRSSVELGAIVARVADALSPKDLLALFVGERNTTDVDLLAWLTRHYSWGNLLWGRSFFDIPLMIVPRTLWPGKPAELGIRLFQEYSGWFDVSNAWHPGMVGELYANYHALGVLLGCLLLGLLSAQVEKWRRSHQQDPATALLYAVFAVKFVLMGAIIGFMMPTIEFLVFALPLSLGARLLAGSARTRSVTDDAHRP